MRKFMITVNGSTYEVDVEEVQAGAAAPVAAAPVAPAPKPVAALAPVAKPAAAPVAKAAAPVAGGEAVKSPMPGTIVDVKVQVGQSVKKGDILCVLEAMKMENEIMAARDGKVAQVVTSKGSVVNAGDTLLTIS